MDLTDIKNNLLNLSLSESDYIVIASEIREKRLGVIKLVESLGTVLTNLDNNIRSKGVDLLCRVIISLDKNSFSQKEIEVLSEFAFLRLTDHKSMEIPTLKCLSYFMDCENKPSQYNKKLLEFLSTKINIRKMDAQSRNQVYEITKKILIERRRRIETIDSDLFYSLIHLIEGEDNPENLLLCFAIVSFVMKNFRDLEPFIDDLFEWLSSYYPIDYTPSEQSSVYGFNIMRTDLVKALYECFYANELNSANLQTLLLEKLDSNVLSVKLESLDCLIRCYQLFPLQSVKDYASSLWTAIRMECLKKISSISPELLETSYAALKALTTKLSEDEAVYFTFITDLYEELAIAFKKPEMELFEAAARLVFNAARPKLRGVNYVLNMILPLSINAIAANELRPLAGLTYIFEELHKDHPNLALTEELNELLQKLLVLVVENVRDSEDAVRLLKAMIRCKLKISQTEDIVSKLLSEVPNSSLDIEECLALICLNYTRTDILFDEQQQLVVDCNISALMKQAGYYKLKSTSHESKFSIYLRLLISMFDQFDRVQLSNINQEEISYLLSVIRNEAEASCAVNTVNLIGRLHAIIINKLDDKYVDPLLMSFFGSTYCQKLVPNLELSKVIYLPVIQWVLKSLVLRNHHFTAPMINLILNYITSDDIQVKSALVGAQVFRFVLIDDKDFTVDKNYQIFALYKQKFYAQTNKEIRIRHELLLDKLKKFLLICVIAIQIPQIQPSIYRKDYEWMLRELLKILSSTIDKNTQAVKVDEDLISVVYQCLDTLIRNDTSTNLSGLTESLVNLNLSYAKDAETLNVRKLALNCLTNISISISSSELLLLRATVLDKLKPCLSDKKRLVRQAAAEARMKWSLIGQPIGS